MYMKSIKTDVEKGKDVFTWSEGHAHNQKASHEGLPSGVLELEMGVAIDKFVGWRVGNWTLTMADSLHLPRNDVVLADEVTYIGPAEPSEASEWSLREWEEEE